MKLNDMDFFHQATKKICGSLDIDIVLSRCMAFFQEFMPLDGIAMNIYSPNAQSIVNIAAKGKTGFSMVEKTIVLPGEAARHLEEDKINSVEIVNRPENHIIGRSSWQALGKKPMSAMVLKIEIEDQMLGVIVFIARGFDRYASEHARLLRLVHDPFAIALANTLKHQEVLRLKDLLADDNKYLTRRLHHISGDETDNQPQSVPAASSKPIQLNDVVRSHIEQVLKMTDGRIQGKKGAAALLGIHPSTLRNKMKKLNIPYGRKAGSLGIYYGS